MKKVLVICGPTAIGKTSLALHLAQRLSGELLSADSRQVYKGMDIGTGKDLPANSKLKAQNPKLGGYYLIHGIKTWGYDLADPEKGFSVGQYAKIAKRIVADIASRGKVPIIVGGTGLYIRSITDTIPTASIPPNKSLRKLLEAKSADELYENLAQLDGVRAAGMNASDKKNPRRLIRAIEIAQHEINNPPKDHPVGNSTKPDILFIGLTAPLPTLFKRSADKIEQRIDSGFDREVRESIAAGVKPDTQAFASIGYKQWLEFLAGKITKAEAIAAWKAAENAYIKRQLTWFRKEKRIEWFDVSEAGWQKKVESRVLKWHNKHSLLLRSKA